MPPMIMDFHIHSHAVDEAPEAARKSDVERHAVRAACPALPAMSWIQRLKRVFSIDIEVCGRCGGAVRVIACMEDQGIIFDKICSL